MAQWRRLALIERRDFRRRKDACARQEPSFTPIVEGEHAATPGHDVENELRVTPSFELGRADIYGDAVNLAKFDIVGADAKLGGRVAHRRRAVATAARLMNEDIGMIPPDFREEGARGVCGCHA